LPVIGEWFALPLIEHAGGKQIGDAVFDKIFHPISRRLVAKGDAVLRIGGASAGADEMVALGDHTARRSTCRWKKFRRQTPVEASSYSGDVALQIESVAPQAFAAIAATSPCSSLSLPRLP